MEKEKAVPSDGDKPEQSATTTTEPPPASEPIPSSSMAPPAQRAAVEDEDEESDWEDLDGRREARFPLIPPTFYVETIY
jgi:hypothetical protein